MISPYERYIRIIDYLKRYTDKNNTVSYQVLKSDEEISRYIGDEKTFRAIIKTAAKILNEGKTGKDRILVYGDNPTKPLEKQRLTKIYYNGPFYEEEVMLLKKGV